MERSVLAVLAEGFVPPAFLPHPGQEQDKGWCIIPVLLSEQTRKREQSCVWRGIGRVT